MPGPHGPVRVPTGFSPASRSTAPDPSGTGRATRAVTRPGARLSDTGGPDDLRERRCRYTRGRRARRALAGARSTLGAHCLRLTSYTFKTNYTWASTPARLHTCQICTLPFVPDHVSYAQ